MAKTKIVVIDDEPSILKIITAYLQSEGYEYKTASDGAQGLSIVLSYQPDVIILDIMLPELDGIEVLTKLRKQSDAYVIMLTAKSEETDKLIGLSVGADDYLTKPFSPRELMARIKAALRRIQIQKDRGKSTEYLFDHVRIDTGARRVWVNNREVELTTLEFNLLIALADHHGMVLSREQLLENVWGFEYFGDLRVVDVHIGHLRAKIGVDVITTVRGIGYRFEDQRN